MRDASAIVSALALLAAASAIAGCRPDPVLAFTDNLMCDVTRGRPIVATPGAQYHIDVRQDGHQRVCYVT